VLRPHRGRDDELSHAIQQLAETSGPRPRTATRGPDSRTTEDVKHGKSPLESFRPEALALCEPDRLAY
jgi:hypothetical protein